MTKITQLHQTGDKQLYSLKLANDTVSMLRQAAQAKLVVKNGEIHFRLDDKVYPCNDSKEFPNLNIFKVDGDNYKYEGVVHTKLQIITDPRKVNELKRKLALQARPNKAKNHEYIKSLEQKYVANNRTVAGKFISYLCLGPTNLERLETWKFNGLNELINSYCSKYSSTEKYQSDPEEYINGRVFSQENNLVLKDKIYKDLRPNGVFEGEELAIIYRNINSSLTRLGYSETHPIRRKISERGVLFRIDTGGGSSSGSTTGSTENNGNKNNNGKNISTVSTTGTSTGSSTSISAGTKVSTTNTTSSANTTTKASTTSTTSSANSTTTSPKSPNIDPKKKKRNYESTSPSSVDSDYEPDLETLVSKFKLKYQQYSKLYNDLKQRKSSNNDKQDLVRLYEMHNYLKQIKVEIKANDGKRVKQN